MTGVETSQAVAFIGAATWALCRGAPIRAVVDGVEIRETRLGAFRLSVGEIMGAAPDASGVFVTVRHDGWGLVADLDITNGATVARLLAHEHQPALVAVLRMELLAREAEAAAAVRRNIH